MIDAFRLLPSGPAAARCEDPEDPEYAWSWARLS
ncbi:homogentisate 1,2-dioxygenase [Thermomonospora echinospora]|uniref:Homogentisate 1,2-dioxygenase n=1 Tax=Thermomonospora echinospora TaxID=1992 RepID=A0A1H6DKK1_9ACTN|nr:homogentisate 1,2-dioxygenase [Thermomonospora echinospora]